MNIRGFRDFPWLFRWYMRYVGRFRDEKSGLTRGGSFLHRVLSGVTRRLGLRDRAPYHLDEGGALYVDLLDGRFLAAIAEAENRRSFEQRVLRSLLGWGDTFLDIGANHGSFSLAAGELVGESGLVVAIEPQRRLAESIRMTLERSRIHRFQVHAVACTDHRRPVKLYVPSEGSGRGSVYRDFAGSGKSFDVPAVRLDDLLEPRDLPGRVLMKLDVEGSELACLKGAERLIAERGPYILFELNERSARAASSSPEALLGYLEELGYRFLERGDTSFRRAGQVRARPHRNLLGVPPTEEAGVILEGESWE